jgi:hypothetical protein
MPETQPSIAGWWATYAERVIPAGAPSVQMQESKRAFYAGAAAMLDAITRGLSEGDDATDDDLAHVGRLHSELVQFGLDVKTGRA